MYGIVSRLFAIFKSVLSTHHIRARVLNWYKKVPADTRVDYLTNWVNYYMDGMRGRNPALYVLFGTKVLFLPSSRRNCVMGSCLFFTWRMNETLK